jgi:CRP-like cAMP-binding protein
MAEQVSWYGSFLAKFSPRVREKLFGLAESFQFKGGEVIFREGAPSLYLYIIKTGRVAVELHVPSKGRRTIDTAGAGDVFDWSSVVEPRLATASARAVEDTEVLGLKGGALMDACREDCELGFELYRAITEVIAARLIATRLQCLDVFSLGEK